MGEKYTDDYDAKLKIWAKERRVWHPPTALNLPVCPSKKFNTIEEYESWRAEYLALVVANGGIKWSE